MNIQAAHRVLVLLAFLAPITTATAFGQAPLGIPADGRVPIAGTTETLALPGDIDMFYSGLHKVAEGTAKALHRGEPDTKEPEPASLASFQPGTPVTVGYVVKGIQASATNTEPTGTDSQSVNQGTITSLDRARNRITVQLGNGTSQTLRASSVSPLNPEEHSRVLVSYTDASGQKVARFFKPVH